MASRNIFSQINYPGKSPGNAAALHSRNIVLIGMPSVYWLYYSDAIWRAEDDFGFAGTGSKRQQWVTYRDGDFIQGQIF